NPPRSRQRLGLARDLALALDGCPRRRSLAPRATPLALAADRPRRVPEPADAELEVVYRNALVRRVDQPRRQLGVERTRREEPVGDGAERFAQPVAVGEAGHAHRRNRGVALDLRDERLD